MRDAYVSFFLLAPMMLWLISEMQERVAMDCLFFPSYATMLLFSLHTVYVCTARPWAFPFLALHP